MAKKQTTVYLTEKARKILTRLEVRDSIKNVVSAGVLLFDRLSPDDKQAIIEEANGFDPASIVASAQARSVSQKQKRPSRSSKSG